MLATLVSSLPLVSFKYPNYPIKELTLERCESKLRGVQCRIQKHLLAKLEPRISSDKDPVFNTM